MTQPSRLHIFQAYGVELEYMIVDRNTLDIRPIADELLKEALGHLGSDFILLRITSMMISYNLSFRILSSVPASILGLSLTSMV